VWGYIRKHYGHFSDSTGGAGLSVWVEDAVVVDISGPDDRELLLAFTHWCIDNEVFSYRMGGSNGTTGSMIHAYPAKHRAAIQDFFRERGEL
jgi:hypothetical protein